MYHRDDIYKGIPEKDVWILLLLGNYAQRKLCERYDDKNIINPITAGSFCSDGRRTPTVRKYLTEKGLIRGSYWNDDHFHPVEEEVEKLLAGSMKEPKFNTSGYITKRESSYSSEEKRVPVTDLAQVYKEVDDLNAYEAIYVYLHQQDYDFKIFTTKYISQGGRRNGFSNTTYTRYNLKLFPVSALRSSDEATLLSNNSNFACHHAKEILTATFGCRFREINDKKEYMSLAAVTSRVEAVETKMRLLGRTLRELKVLERKAGQLGDGALQKRILDSSLEYLRERAPLWINSTDETKKELSVLVCKGAKLTLEKTECR